MNALERHARRATAQIPSNTRAVIATDPQEALRTYFGLQVRPVTKLTQRRGEGGWCDGLSFFEHGVVLYAPTPNSRRENFTIVHELAHKLINDDEDVLDWLADLDHPGRDLERHCDRIAAMLLLPDQTLHDVLHGDPPSASHVRQLHDGSAASEQVCAIALARRLPCQGALLIMQLGADTVDFASIATAEEDGWPLAYPWPRQHIPAHHPLGRLRPNQAVRTRSW